MKHTDRKRESAGDRKRQRQAEQARIKAENEPIHLKPGESDLPQMSGRAARTTPLASMANRGGKEHAKFVEEQRPATIKERMGRVIRPADDNDPSHGHEL